ncbi:hypothetical protein TIFTF001_038336 [Ficus carica]|uniref:Uncharacterized protein n=1 Tax=Ficus carica TaxID=3494 RepID=A0AA88E737_FICCA|nr:hypothetical protein TIFTF001_038336 [Ficus carica]
MGDGSKSRPGSSVPDIEDSRSRDPPAAFTGAEPIKRKSSTQRAVATKFDDHLSSEVVESSRCSDHIQASEDIISNAAARDYSNRTKEKVASLVAEVKKWKEAKKAAFEKAKKAEEHFAKEVLPAALDQAHQQAIADFQRSAEFEAHLLVEYNEGIRDMKVGFAMSNPMVTGADWSSMPEISGDTAAKEEGAATGGAEEGEVTGGAQVTEDVVVIDELEVRVNLAGTEQAAPVDQQLVGGLPGQTIGWSCLDASLVDLGLFRRMNPKSNSGRRRVLGIFLCGPRTFGVLESA